jgi:hypothetical protein
MFFLILFALAVLVYLGERNHWWELIGFFRAPESSEQLANTEVPVAHIRLPKPAPFNMRIKVDSHRGLSLRRIRRTPGLQRPSVRFSTSGLK